MEKDLKLRQRTRGQTGGVGKPAVRLDWGFEIGGFGIEYLKLVTIWGLRILNWGLKIED